MSLELVREQTAAVLGHDSGEDIAPDRLFKEMGIDSLGAVELRNRLHQLTGVQLPSTAVFDHPTPAELATFVAAEGFQGARPPGNPGIPVAGRGFPGDLAPWKTPR